MFTKRTNPQLAREKDNNDTAAEPAPRLPQAQESSSAALCAGRTTATHRVALITEQMPSWRERRQRWQARQPPGVACDEEASAADAGPKAASEVLDILTALLCAGSEHDRLVAARREQVEATAGQRRPTMYSAGSIGTLIAPTLQALSEILGQASPTRSGLGSGTSTRSSFVTRGKKRRGSSPSSGDAGAASPPAPSRWTSLVVGQRLTSCVDRVHLAGLFFAWEAWHPWVEKEAPASASSLTGRLSLRQTRTWQTFCSLMGYLAQGCVSPRPSPPPGQGLATLVTQTALSFRTAGRRAGDPLPFLDMPAVLLLCKVRW